MAPGLWVYQLKKTHLNLYFAKIATLIYDHKPLSWKFKSFIYFYFC